MRTFVIADSSKRKARPIGVLTWDPESEYGRGAFSLQLCSGYSELQLPLSLSFCARREDKRATPQEARDWVRSRIVPEARHNIAEVLKANGLADYDEVGLLAACGGRSSDDDLLVYEVEMPDGFACESSGADAIDEQGTGRRDAHTQSMADRVAAAVRRQRLGAKVIYAFVGLDGPVDDDCRTSSDTDAPFELKTQPSAALRIGSLIRAERQEQGLTQKQLAARAGITQTVLSRTESGSGNPTLSLLEEIAAALDMHLEIHLDK